MPVLTKEFFSKPSLRRYRDVELPDGVCRLQSLTERERAEFELVVEKSQKDRETKRRLKAYLIAACLVDESGEKLFQPAEVDSLLSLDSLLTAKLFDACVEHCGFSKEDRDNVEKNSD